MNDLAPAELHSGTTAMLEELAKRAAPFLGVSLGEIDAWLAERRTRAGSARVRSRDVGERWQDALIELEIPEGAKVLDLGCGDGALLERLGRSRRVRGQGVELDPEAVFACVARGVPVFQADLDAGLAGLPSGSFDYVVLEETLQTLHRPLAVLGEMLRVGQRGIISFPNFAHWKVRLELLIHGKMPVTHWLPYDWHDSPNIHLFTIADFQDWAASARVAVCKGWALVAGEPRELIVGNELQAEEALLVVERADQNA